MGACGAEAVRPVAERWFRSCASFFRTEDERYDDDLVKLILELPHYDALMRLLDEGTYFRTGVDSEALRVAEDAQRLAEETGDPALAACAAYVLRPREFERELRQVPLSVSPSVCELFARGRERYLEAAEWFEAAGQPEAAMRVCRRQRDGARVGAILERAGRLKEAAKVYMEAEAYEEALRCSRACGDEVREARTYERMGRFGEAVAIWERRGNARDAARVRRKMGQPENSGRRAVQQELFEDS